MTSVSSPKEPKSGPTNPLVTALLTDLYQITMTYAHWKNNKHLDSTVFELFFRKNPFKGEFTIFCGLDECLKHLSTFKFSPSDITYLKSTPTLHHAEPEFFDYLESLSTKDATQEFKVHALEEGTVVFPKVPMLIIQAPLGLGQLLETTLLNLVNYPSLLATNAARMVLRAQSIPCIEFGLRRAQGPDGALSASKYSYVGGFVATSNVQAGKLFQIPISGTHAHSFVQSFVSLEEVEHCQIFNKTTNAVEPFLPRVLHHRSTSTTTTTKTNDGELAAFVAYACAFPDTCLCLIDTYDTVQSGLQNFVYVALALTEFGYTPKGVRLDSGDLAALSLECKTAFHQMATRTGSSFWKNLTIVASNDINEDVLQELTEQPHGLTAYGIGTNLVTCQKQPALGCVYKLVEWKGQPRIKLSQEFGKITIPGQKRVYRLYGEEGHAIVDYMKVADDEEDPIPQVGQRIVCRHPFQPDKRFVAIPSKVVPLHTQVFPPIGVNEDGDNVNPLSIARYYVKEQLTETFSSELTAFKPTKSYDVMVSQKLFDFLRTVWAKEAPLEERR